MDYKRIVIYSIIILLVFAVSQGRNHQTINRLSTELATIGRTNEELRSDNTSLIDQNRKLAESITELERRIIEDNIKYKERIGDIKSTITELSKGITSSKTGIRGIIEGIEQIKRLVEAL